MGEEKLTALFTLRRHTAESHHAALATAERTMTPAKMYFLELDFMLAIKERTTNPREIRRA
jgi:hypothetical protein